jgi:hypothetical protein
MVCERLFGVARFLAVLITRLRQYQHIHITSNYLPDLIGLEDEKYCFLVRLE